MSLQSARQRDVPSQQARSPPSAAKNLQHVPCRFYRSGQCTAGRNCVFSHDLQQETERAPCKYFQKGNCRFGAKCALAHILPDGRRVNHVSRTSGPAPVFGRIVPENRPFHSSGIHDQLVQSQHSQSPTSIHKDDFPALGSQLQGLQLRDIPPQDHESKVQSPYDQRTSPSGSLAYPTDENNSSFSNKNGSLNNGVDRVEQRAQQRQLSQTEYMTVAPRSPSGRTLGPLDAQLPASLDSNGISWFARHGPVAASVPHTRGFGMPETFTSHPSSPLPNVTVQPSTSLFMPNLGTSPRNTTLGRAMFERRASAIIDRTEDNELVFEEDFVPSSLNELLTPAERHRRDSRGADEHISKSPSGSASGSPSSSRFGPLFSKHKAAEAGMRNSPGTGSQGGILPIGSPLARSTGASSNDNVLSPPRMQRNGSSLRTDMKPNAKEFSLTKEKDFKNEDEPFEMDI